MTGGIGLDYNGAVGQVRKLEAATFVRANSSIVCPAAWAPGEATLTPSPALVGQL